MIIKKHTCPECGIEKTIDQFPLTKEKYYTITNDEVEPPERRKLNKCRECLRAYQRQKKEEQRERERAAKAMAEQFNSSTVLLPVQPKTPLEAVGNDNIVNVNGKLYRKL